MNMYRINKMLISYYKKKIIILKKDLLLDVFTPNLLDAILGLCFMNPKVYNISIIVMEAWITILDVNKNNSMIFN